MDIPSFLNRIGVGVVFISDSDLFINSSAKTFLNINSKESFEDVKDALKKTFRISIENIFKAFFLYNRSYLIFSSCPLNGEGEKNEETVYGFCFFCESETKQSPDILIMIIKDKIMYYAEHIKQHLMGMAVHDVKTPLSSIKESSSLLFDGTLGELNDMQKKCVEIVKKEIGRVHRITENIARIGMFEKQSLLEGMESIQIGDIFSVLTERSRDKCQKKKIKFVVEDEMPDSILIFAPKGIVLDLLYYLLDYILENIEAFSEIHSRIISMGSEVKIVFSFTGNIQEEEVKIMLADFWLNKKTALIRKENLDAFSLRICSFYCENLKGKIEVKQIDSKQSEISINLPEMATMK